MRQFSVGEVVTWIPDLFLRRRLCGDYRIVATMPDRDGQHMYRIKSPLEEYERAVKEDVLAKSDGYLPEKASRAGVAPQLSRTADFGSRVRVLGQTKTIVDNDDVNLPGADIFQQFLKVRPVDFLYLTSPI